MTPPIAILGAGPSGLTLARIFHNANIAFIIFEQDQTPVGGTTVASGRGGTLDIHANSGQVALKEAGLWDQFKKMARYDATVTIADAKGKVHLKVGDEYAGTNDKPEVDRKDLRALLLGSIPSDSVRWGCKVEKVQRDTAGLMSVYFANGEVESGFKLVVGADGAWSKARSLVTSAKPQYSGIHYLTTSIGPENPFHSTAAVLAENGLHMAMGDEKQMVVVKLGDGSYYIGFGLRLPEHWSKDHSALLDDSSALRQWLLDDVGFSNWAKLHTDLIRHSDGDFYCWPLFSMPLSSLSWYRAPGVALVGDAAHLTTPFVGEGVNCALYDSYQLAKKIIEHGLDGLDRAVSEYEAEMFPRAKDVIQRSMESGDLYFAEDAPKGWLKAVAGMEMD